MAHPTVVQEHVDGVHIISFPPEGEHGGTGLVGGQFELISRFFAEEFLVATRNSERLLVDLSSVPTLDSSALGPLVQKLRDLQERGGSMALCGLVAPGLREIFALTRFDKIFPLHRDRAEALAALAAA